MGCAVHRGQQYSNMKQSKQLIPAVGNGPQLHIGHPQRHIGHPVKMFDARVWHALCCITAPQWVPVLTGHHYSTQHWTSDTTYHASQIAHARHYEVGATPDVLPGIVP